MLTENDTRIYSDSVYGETEFLAEINENDRRTAGFGR